MYEKYKCSNCKNEFDVNTTAHHFIFYCPKCKQVDILVDYKRRFPRKQCEVTATLYYYVNGIFNETTVIIKNISLHGYKLFFIDASVAKQIEPGSSCKIKYILPDKQQSQIEEVLNLIHFLPNEFCWGVAVHNPVDYSFNIRKKGFWLMDIPLDTPEKIK